ncbi:hypothetical protein V5799_031983, partial [Amblyomma americanum]
MIDASWDERQTKLLLDYYARYARDVGPLKKFRSKRAMFEQIACDMFGIPGIHRTAVQCETRFKTVSKRKRNEEKHNNTSGNSRCRVEYEQESDAIKAIDDSLEPEVLRGVDTVRWTNSYGRRITGRKLVREEEKAGYVPVLASVGGGEEPARMKGYRPLRGRRLAERSVEKLPIRLPSEALKIVLRPSGGVGSILHKIGSLNLACVIAQAAGVDLMEAAKDTVIPNLKQQSILIATTNEDRARKYLRIKGLATSMDSVVDVTAYEVAPENCGKGVIHGIDTARTSEQLKEIIRMDERNPPILG